MAGTNRVAVIGTSLLGAEAAEMFISEGSSVTFFESSRVGGAWGSYPVGESSFFAPRFNNLIFPYSKSQQELLRNYSRKFKRLQLPVAEMRPDWASPETNTPTKILAGDFSESIRRTVSREEVTVVSLRVTRIEVAANHVSVNGEFFDYVVLPQNAAVPSVTFSGVQGSEVSSYASKTSHWETNRSEHVRLLFTKGPEHQIPLYSEGGDPVFDRFGSIPGGQGCFIGRVRREFKGTPAQTLLKKSPHTAPLATRGSIFDLQMYSQTRMVPELVERLRKLSMGTRLIFLDGIDFLTGVETARERITSLQR